MKIIVTGSLGHISCPLTQGLLEKNHSVTVITTKPERQEQIEALGAHAAIGPVEDAHFLQETFSGADAVYCMIPPNFREPDQIEYYQRIASFYARAIKHSGVRRVIYLSSYGAHLSSGTGFVTGSYKGEQILNAIPGVSVTHIRPTYFYYNLFGFIPMIRAAGFMGSVYGAEDMLAMVSPVDIASAILEEITQSHSANTVRYVTSSERTCNEVAAVLGKAIGMPELQWRILPEEQVRQALLANGVPANAAMNLIELGNATHSGVIRGDFERNIPQAGKVTLEDFAIDFAAHYNNQ